MLRTIWKGAISFGLVSIPVKLFPATENKDVKFRYLHKTCQAPVRYQKVCTACGMEVSQDDLVRGYEYEPGRFVIINEEDLERVPDGKTRTVDIIDFVSLKDIDPIYFDKTYYLAPGEVGEKPYALLRKAMEETGKIAVAKISIRNKEALAVIRGYREYLVLETIFYPDEIRDTAQLPGFDKGIKLHENEIKMARELIENLATEFDPQKYDDNYRKKLLDLIHAKIEGQEIIVPDVPSQGKVVDLMEALKASVEMARKTAGSNDGKPKSGRRRKVAGE